jgi:hypothetical protein
MKYTNRAQSYINHFFDRLEVYEDLTNGHYYKTYIQQSILEFLENETKETAFSVYESFFNSYRITLEGESNPFIDLLDVLHNYEQNAATLIDRQRDHYIHSVNVFILGLCIFSQNSNFRDAFNLKILDKADYPNSYNTENEEFFYRWGLATLFHDVGYPVEIIGKQISKFLSFVTEVDSGVKIKTHLEFENFAELNSITEIIPKSVFTRNYYEKFDSCVYVDLLKPTDLLAHKLHTSLGVDLKEIQIGLEKFVETMAKNGFIDHGFFSAIIVLKWYGYLIQKCNYKPTYFFHPILDSASAILLHNYYRNALMKPPFNKEPLAPKDHPIAYLLILCDELQEWNRNAYGIADKKRVLANAASLEIEDTFLHVTYITKEVSLPEQFSTEKVELFNQVLDMKAVFTDGFTIDSEQAEPSAVLLVDKQQETQLLPRPLLENLERLAISIHELYNQKQLERFPNKPLLYPTFEGLPTTLKYSNLRQARSIFDKLELMGFKMSSQSREDGKISSIPDDIVEKVARFEHNEWLKERLSTGWKYGVSKNVEKKTSPYLVAYEDLSEEIKNLNRDVIRNIPELLRMIGISVYKPEE